jgi:hypothetical protein
MGPQHKAEYNGYMCSHCSHIFDFTLCKCVPLGVEDGPKCVCDTSDREYLHGVVGDSLTSSQCTKKKGIRFSFCTFHIWC